MAGTNPFGRYYAEILRAEGLNAFDVKTSRPSAQPRSRTTTSSSSATQPLTAAQVTMFTDWVTARRQPDRDAAGQAARGLLGLTDAGATLANAYLKVDTSGAPGDRHRLADDPVPRHGRPVHVERRDRGRDALFAPPPPRRRIPPSRCAASARTAGTRRPSRSTSRARSSTRARAIRHGPATRATARTGRSAPTTSSSEPNPATSSPTGSTSRRSRSRRPTNSSACSRT